jgi:hypothetical protein
MGRNHRGDISVETIRVHNVRHKNYLHKFLHHISPQDVIEHSLQELISNDGKL